jgi:short-subunit dehydrogenase
MLVYLAVAVVVGAFLYYKFKLPSFSRDINKQKNDLIVTGGGTGFGFLKNKKKKALGSVVFACDMNVSNMSELSKEKNCIVIKLNVTSKSDLQDAEKVVKEHLESLHKEGRLDTPQLFGVVNCAGIPTASRQSIVEKDDAELEKTFDVNVFGVHRVTKTFYPLLSRNNTGCIINIASVCGTVAFPFGGFYNASKVS